MPKPKYPRWVHHVNCWKLQVIIAIAVLVLVVLAALFIGGKPVLTIGQQTQKTYEACVFYDARAVATPFVYDTGNKTQADSYFKIAFSFKPTGILCTQFNITGSGYTVSVVPPEVLYNISATKPPPGNATIANLSA